MRQERITQASLFDIFATHEIGRELKQISQWLDQHRPLLRLVSNDLRRDGVRETGRRGLPAEAVLRCALLKQYRQLSYEELVPRVAHIAGYNLFSFTRASAVVKCQSALTCFLFRLSSQAATSSARVSLSGIRRSRH
jgi:IS5 family transposase